MNQPIEGVLRPPQHAAVDTFVERAGRLLLHYRRWGIVGVHLLLIPLVYLAAFALRFDPPFGPALIRLYLATLPPLLVLRLIAFWRFGLFHGFWLHVGMRDLASLVAASALSSLAFAPVLAVEGLLAQLPIAVILLDAMLAILVFGGIRFAVRGLRERRAGLFETPTGKPTLIVGTGGAGERLLRELQYDGRGAVAPVGFVDDDPSRHGQRLHGVPVLGAVADLPDVVSRYGVQLIAIAVTTANRKEMQRIVDACIRSGAEYKILPSLRERLNGGPKSANLRSVQIEDLLAREPIRLDMAVVEREIAGSTVLVTGAGGSIGSELARRIATYKPARLVLLDRAETNLYYTYLEVSEASPDVRVDAALGSITDAARLKEIFSDVRPDYVFHAAAYKHVPMLEEQVLEAVANNVIGTLRVAWAAVSHGVRRFVLISTDKAVHPSCVMGATKRIAERVVLGLPALKASGTDFRAVRFGNVLGSDGSVLPVFRRKLAAGVPLTVTHPDMTRYFMTIPEAVQLVLQSAAVPEAIGRVSILEMGEPVRILELAENLVRLSGLEPYVDVPIVFTGLRPGEKLREELTSSGETTVPTSLSHIRVVETNDDDGAEIQRGLTALFRAVRAQQLSGVLSAVLSMVPECVNPLRDQAETMAKATPRPAEHVLNGSRPPAAVFTARSS